MKKLLLTVILMLPLLPVQGASESVLKSVAVIEAIQLKTDWTKKDFVALAKKLADATPEDDKVQLGSIRFYESEDTFDIAFLIMRDGHSVGGWKITVSNNGKNYVYKSKEWFDA